MSSAVGTETLTSRRNDSGKRTISARAGGPGDAENSYDHFFWTYTEEPHRTRRQAIIKAHPEVGDARRSQLSTCADRCVRSRSSAGPSL